MTYPQEILKKIPKFTPTGKTYSEAYIELGEYEEMVARLFPWDMDKPEDLGVLVDMTNHNYYELWYDPTLRTHNQFGDDEYFGDLYEKEHPKPNEYEYDNEGDVYDPKRQLMVTPEKRYQKDAKLWQQNKAKFINNKWGIMYGHVSDELAKIFEKELGLDPHKYGLRSGLR